MFGVLRVDGGLSGLLSAFENERRKWYAQQSALLDRVTALEGRLADNSWEQLADDLALAKIAVYHLRERLSALETEVEALQRSTCAL